MLTLSRHLSTWLATGLLGALLSGCGGGSDTTSTSGSTNLPTATLSATRMAEGNSGTSAMTITLTLDQPAASNLSVRWRTADGSAKAGSDYRSASGIFSLNQGELSKSISITLFGDTFFESDETFTIELNSPSGVTLSNTSLELTILNDDSLEIITQAQSINEGTATNSQLRFTVSLSAPVYDPVTIDYSTRNITANAGSDYQAVSGTLTFTAQSGPQSIDIPVFGDPLVEADESFQLLLSGPAGLQAITTGTLRNDDTATISVSPAGINEGNSGITQLPFTLRLDQTLPFQVTVGYTTIDGTAVGNSDYTPQSGTAVFPAGVSHQTIKIDVLADLTPEPSETFTLSLNNAVGAAIGTATAIGTIGNDDRPSVSISGPSNAIAEGNTGQSNISFKVQLNQPALESVSVAYTTIDGSATGGSDYTSISGRVTFNPGEDTKFIDVSVAGDIIDEFNELFSVLLSGPQGVIITTAQAEATILDDDGLTLHVADAEVLEGDTGTTALNFLVTLDQPGVAPVNVDYTTNDASASVADSDYTPIAGTLVFNPGETSKTLSVSITADTRYETSELIGLTLSNSSSGTQIGRAQAIGTIIGDDLPLLSVTPVIQAEGDGAGTLQYDLTLSAPALQAVTVDYTTADLSATAGSDYTAINGTLTFAKGESSKQLSVAIIGDTVIETDEQFQLSLTNPKGCVLAANQIIATLNNDDSAVLNVSDVAITEGDSGSTTVTFQLKLNQATLNPVTLTYATSDITASAGSDYDPISGTLTFNPGELVKPLEVLVHADPDVELDEQFALTLTNLQGASGGRLSAVGTLRNDDNALLSIADISRPEGNGIGETLRFTLLLDRPTAAPVSVAFSTLDGTAHSGSDYVSRTGSLQFNPGELSKQVDITIIGDTTVETDEQFTLQLSNLLGAQANQLSAGGTLVNDDVPTLNVPDIQLSEGDSGTTDLTITLTLDQPAAEPISLEFATADLTATAGSDYTPHSGTLVFNATELSKTVVISVLPDTKVEHDESFYLNLSNPVGLTLATPQVTATLLNDDTAYLSLSGAQLTEGDSGTQVLTFSLTLDQPTVAPVTVDYASRDLSTTAGVDYTPVLGSVQFAAGETQKSINVDIIGDTRAEIDEQFQLDLTNPVGALITTPSAVATLVNDDYSQITIADAQVSESHQPGGTLDFTVSLDQSSPVLVTVDYLSSDGTAIAGSDYSPVTGTLTFLPGELTHNVSVPLLGDLDVERDETLSLTLSTPHAATLGNTTATGTLLNDDSAILSIASVSSAEGDATGNTLNFTITLDRPTLDPVTLSYASQDGTALSASDYVPIAGQIGFQPGELSKQLSMQLTGDLIVEHNETFDLVLSGLNGADPGQMTATATITNDDLPKLSLSAPSLVEGSGSDTLFRFNLTLDQPAADPVSVTYATQDGTALTGSDYNTSTGTLTFATGEQSKVLDITVLGDTRVEADETFTLALSSPIGLTLNQSSIQATILNDDQPTATVADVTIDEGQSGTTQLRFVVSLDQAPLAPVSLAYATADGTALTGSDYTASSGSLTFAAGEQTKNIDIAVVADLLVEPNETLTLALSTPVGLTLATAQATATINNDDELLVGLSQGATLTEGAAGSTAPMQFTITLSEPAPNAVSVNYATGDGTALAGSDYAATAGTLNFAIGEFSKTVSVTITGDDTVELDESFNLILSGPIGAKLATNAISGQITNDDLSVVSIADVSAAEGATGATNQLTLLATLDQPSPVTVSVDYASADGTAVAGSDYQTVSGTLSFPPGTSSLPINVTLIGDGTVERDEQFSLTLTNLQGVAAGVVSATATITNDDGVVLSITPVSATEGDSGTSTLTFTASLDQPALDPVTFDYATSDLTATAGSDYVATSGTASIPAGNTSLTFDVTINGDTTVERDETFTFALSNLGGGQAGTMSAIATLFNDDTAVLSTSPASLSEGDSGSSVLVFSVTLDREALDPVTIDYATSDLEAISGTDYTATSGNLNFAAGETLKTISVNITGDTTYEADERLRLTLSGLQGANAGTLVVDGTISNDDAPTLSVADATLVEGDSGVNQITFTIVLEGPAHQITTIDYATRDISATAGSDYTAASGTLSIPVNTASSSISIDILGDTLAEGDETFSLDLSNPSGVNPLTSSALGTVFTDDLFRTLNDTGISRGGLYPIGNNTDCSGETPSAQDCSQGRDTTHPLQEEGELGFSFTKLDAAGNPLAATATQWSCVRDNVTGLIWEGKTSGDGISGNQGMHDADDRFNWYDTNPATNGGQSGFADALGSSCAGYSASDPTSYCSTEAFVARTNANSLCGASDWRMPSIAELHTLTHLGQTSSMIDTNWFPATKAGYHWSGTAAVGNPNNAWGLDFSTAADSPLLSRLVGRAVRLVREAP